MHSLASHGLHKDGEIGATIANPEGAAENHMSRIRELLWTKACYALRCAHAHTHIQTPHYGNSGQNGSKNVLMLEAVGVSLVNWRLWVAYLGLPSRRQWTPIQNPSTY